MDGSVEGARSTRSARRRGFVELHRDAWRVIRTAPAGSWEQLRLEIRLGVLGSATVGTFASAAVLAALVDVAGGRVPTVGRALREGLRPCGARGSRLGGTGRGGAARAGRDPPAPRGRERG